MFSSSYSTRENELLELVYVKEEIESSSVDDVHLDHVIVKEEHDEHQLPSPNLSKLDADHPEPAIGKKEKDIEDQISVGSEHLHGNEDLECEAVGGSDSGASGSSPSSFAVHLQKHHPLPRMVRGFVSTNLQQHLGRTLSNSQLDCKVYEPDCTVIQKQDFISVSSEENKFRVKKFVCTHCKYNTDHENFLQRHVCTSDSNQGKLFACNQCEYSTDTKSYLKRHLPTHNNNRDKLFACNHCNYRSVRKDDLKKHLLTHGSDQQKPFVCNHCEFGTHNKSHLNTHLLTHESNQDKQFICKECKYRTLHKSHINAHLLTHDSNRGKPFVCKQCEYRTDRKGNLNAHILTHGSNQDKTFVCNHCEYKTIWKCKFKKHSLTKHINQDK